jgi:hypothetical protein
MVMVVIVDRVDQVPEGGAIHKRFIATSLTLFCQPCFFIRETVMFGFHEVVQVQTTERIGTLVIPALNVHNLEW